MEATRLVTILFNNKISEKEIASFRGSIIKLSGDNPLFHNHNKEGFNYTYPLVQYKCIDGCAAIVGIDKGADAIEDLFKSDMHIPCQLNNRKMNLELSAIRSEKVWIKCETNSYTYSISGWLPLNSENYKKYQQTQGLVSRIGMLERILVGNILSFAKGVGIYFDHTVNCQLLDLTTSDFIKYKEVELMNFSASFQCNVTLPEYIGLGKSVSINNGIITRIK